jgi:hypothetical protein
MCDNKYGPIPDIQKLAFITQVIAKTICISRMLHGLGPGRQFGRIYESNEPCRSTQRPGLVDSPNDLQ